MGRPARPGASGSCAQRPQRHDRSRYKRAGVGCAALGEGVRRVARVVGPAAAVDLLLEAGQQTLTAPQPGLDLLASVGFEPVAVAGAIEPASNLVQVLLDLRCFLERVVLPKVLELDLFDEPGLTVLDD